MLHATLRHEAEGARVLVLAVARRDGGALARAGQAPAAQAQAQSLRDREILEFLEGSGI